MQFIFLHEFALGQAGIGKIFGRVVQSPFQLAGGGARRIQNFVLVADIAMDIVASVAFTAWAPQWPVAH